MADLLWQKPGVAVDAKIQTFLAGDDVILDREFFLYDVAASKAQLAQGAADDLFQQMPLPVEPHAALLHAGHVQQVFDKECVGDGLQGAVEKPVRGRMYHLSFIASSP